MKTPINYCIRCAHPVSQEIPPGDNLPRAVCPKCGHIHYENPHLIVGCIAEWEGRILLCQRAIEPRLGFWTLPAGFMENGETTLATAIRETREESGAMVTDAVPFALVSIAHIHQVHLFYRAQLHSPALQPGEESLTAALYDENELPWSALAFRSVDYCLRRYLEDRRQNCFQFHHFELEALPATTHSTQIP